MADDSIPVEHLFSLDLTADMPPHAVLRGAPYGTRAAAGITDGTFAGPKLRGRVATPAGDWFTVRRNGSIQLDVRLLLVTDDGASILAQYKGIGTRAEDGTTQLRSAPQFETGDERYAWLNDVQAVGIGSSDGKTVHYEVYALR